MDRAGWEAIDEVAAQLVLYGPQTRSGQVRFPFHPDWGFDFYRNETIDLWMIWDSVAWFVPRHSAGIA